MTDTTTQLRRRIHLAYAAASSGLPAPLVQALEAAGFEVSHAPSTHTIDDAALASARLVLVCWTPAAVASDAVTLHAARARKAGKLASVLLAPCTPPSSLGRHYLLADLSGWRGDATDREFVQLVHAIHARQSRRLFSSAPQWAARYMSWGGLGAVALGTVAIVANFGDVRQTIDGVFNPSASEAALSATDAKVEEVLTLLKQKSAEPLSADTEAALRESIERLLSAQSGARGSAAHKLEKGDLDGALDDLNAAAQEGEKAAAGLAETWQEIGALTYADDTLSAIAAYRRAVGLAPNDVVARYQLGSLLIRSGDLDEAENIFNGLRWEDSDDYRPAIALGYLGVIARTRGDLEAAQKYFELALGMNEGSGDLQGQANDLGDIGEIARMRADYAKAETNFRKSRDLFRQINNPEGEGIALARLGAVARDRKRYGEAETFFNSALAIAQDAADREGQAFAYSGLGDTAFDRGRIDDALAYYRASFEAADRIIANESRAVALIGLGNVSERLGDKIAAINFFREALLTYQKMGLVDDVDEMGARLKKLGATPSPEGAEN